MPSENVGCHTPPPLGAQKPVQKLKEKVADRVPPPPWTVKSQGSDWVQSAVLTRMKMESGAKSPCSCSVLQGKWSPGTFKSVGPWSKILEPHLLSWPPPEWTRQLKCQVQVPRSVKLDNVTDVTNQDSRWTHQALECRTSSTLLEDGVIAPDDRCV